VKIKGGKMKFADFKDNLEMLTYFGYKILNGHFMNFDSLPPVEMPHLLKRDIDFALANRGSSDMEFYACEFLISPVLKEIWMRNPKLKLFSHIQIKYEDLILVPDYIVTPKDKIGLNSFKTPLLITVEAKNDDFELGWSDVYKQLIVARSLNANEEIPIYAIVSIGKAWEFGKLEGKIIYKHPNTVGINKPDELLGILDFIFADCVKTAEKFDLF
jgi:hypothetical protein